MRLHEVAVPLAKYEGWNFRKTAVGEPQDLVPLLGAWMPFSPTRAAREAAKDPRVSIGERYASRADYLTKFEAATATLVQQGYLLADDVAAVNAHAVELWEFVTTSAK